MDAKTYQGEAGFTMNNHFHGDKVTVAELRGRIIDAIRAGNALDQVKKALFYGKGNDIGLTNSNNVKLAMSAPAAIAGMSGPIGAAKALPWNEDQAVIVLHMIIGVVTEGTEMLEALLKALDGEAPPDRINLLEEGGDVLWYLANYFTALGSDFETEFGRNNAKLRKRFPAGFTERHAIDRDTTAEREVLEGQGDLLPVYQVGQAEPIDYVPREPLKLTAPDTVGSCQSASQCPTPIVCRTGNKACHLAG